MENTKERIIIEVLEKRSKICHLAMDASKKRGNEEGASYYEGKIDGYQQAIDLIKDSAESAAIEL